MIQAFIENPILLLFVVIGLGYSIGRIKIKGSGLGVAAVLFTGLAFGALDASLRIPEIIIFLGLTIFVYTIGLQSGPGFFSNFKKRGFKDLIFVFAMLSFSAGIAIGLHYLFGFKASTTAGLWAGVTTNTPALAGLLDAISNTTTGELTAKLSNEVVVGFSLSYPMGVLGVMVAILWMQKILKVDYRAEEKELSKEYPVNQDVGNLTVEITKEASTQIPLRDLTKANKCSVVFGRMKRGDTISLPNWDTKFQLGDLVRIVGSRAEIERVAVILGVEKPEELVGGDASYEIRRIFVSNPEVVGQKIAALNLSEKYAAIITRVRRGDIDLLATGDTELELGDQIRFVARREDMPKLEKLFGDSYEALSQVNLLSFGLGMALGLLLGMITFQLPGGTEFKLGFAGGPLIVALLLGTIKRTGPIVWVLPYSANLTLRQIGLILLLAGIGINSGHTFLSTIMGGGGGKIFLASAIISIFVTLMTLLIGFKVLKIPFSFLTGMSSNQPAILDFSTDQSKNKLPNIGFTTMLPVALITKILFVQLLYALLN
ncbi:MAG: putative transport protein [Saprospiraceae bacterium]|jgi:putative transport protein